MFKRRISLWLLALCLFSLPWQRVQAAAPTDTDGDGLSDQDELVIYHTDPVKIDTDADGFTDGEEAQAGYSPLVAEKKKMTEVDTDNDGLSDALEIALGTDLKNADTDADGFADGSEVMNGFNPWVGGNNRSVQRSVTVDLSTQQLTYFVNNVPIGRLPVSSGTLRTLTPNGTFSILRKLPSHRYTGPTYDFPNTKWNLEFKRGFYLHGAYWHNQFGIRPMSHGCVNLATTDAEKLYRFLDIGDTVSIAGKTPRLVLAKE